MPETVELADLAQNVLAELNRRLGDEDLAKELPGGHLVQLAIKLQSQPEPEDETEPEVTDILGSLDSLPPAHAKRLLHNEIKRLSALILTYQDALLRVGL